MIRINLDNFIPPELQQKLIDSAVDFLTEKAKDYVSEQMSAAINQLRSDHEFQKKFRNGLKNGLQRFYDEYADKDEDLVAALFRKNFLLEEQNIQNAILEVIKNPGKYKIHEKRIIEQSFENVLPERINRDRVDRAVSFLIYCLTNEVCDLPELRSAYQIDFLRSTSEGIKVSVQIQRKQLQTLREINNDIKDALLYFTERLAEKKLESNDYPSVLHNLPRYDEFRFVGREEKIGEIHKRLSPSDRYFVITIDGIGGVGKSTLALEAAYHYVANYHKIPEDERFDAVIWTTAKRTILTGEGILNRVQSLKTLEDIYATIAITLEREDIIRSPVELQDDLVQKALISCRVLLVIDNFETVDDERVLSFIREIPNPTKVIVTTRRKIDTALPIRLESLSEKESILLIQNELIDKDIVITSEELLTLARATSGLPLAIIWGISLLHIGYSFSNIIERLQQPRSELSKFCFDETINLIKSHSSYRLLLALSLFSNGIDRIAAGKISDLDQIERDNGLVELEKLSLVNRTGNRFTLLPLTRVYAQYEIQENRDYAQQAVVSGGSYLASQLVQSSDWYWIEDQAGVLINGENFLGLLDWAILFNNIETIKKVIKPSVLFLDYTGRRGEASELIYGILDIIESDKTAAQVCAWLHLKNGWLITQQGEDQKKAMQELLLANVAYSKLGIDNGLILAKCFFAQATRHFAKNQKVKSNLEELLIESQNSGYPEGVILTEYELAKVYRLDDDWNSAYHHICKAYEELSSQESVIGNWFSLTKEAIKGNYAEVAYTLGRMEESEKAVLQVLASLEKWEQFNLATNFWARMWLLDAKIKHTNGKLHDAEASAHKALKLAQSTNNQHFISEVKKLFFTN